MNLTSLRGATAALLCTAVLSACGSSQSASGPHQFTASGYGPYTPASITLTDTSGKPYELAKTPTTPVTLVFFGYTHCDDTCPAVMSQLASAFTRLSPQQASQVSMVFVTSDPTRDSGPVERRWLDRYNKTFNGLTGPIGQISSLAASLHLAVDGSASFTMHDTHVVALDAQHQTVALWESTTSSKQYAGDIQALLNGETPQ